MDIDFAAPGDRPWAAGWLVLLLGLGGLALAALDLRDAQSGYEQARARMDRSAPAGRSSPGARAPSVPPEQLRAVERAQAALDRPWGLLWRELEVRMPSDVALLAIEATGSSRGNAVRLVGEARDVAQAVRWVEALRAAPIVRSADLAHHERRDSGGVELVRFSIDLRWGGVQP